MSYCSAQRLAKTRQVQLLEQNLRELTQAGAPISQLEIVKQRLIAAQAELAALGDCGD
jgi:hypothetical protein